MLVSTDHASYLTTLIKETRHMTTFTIEKLEHDARHPLYHHYDGELLPQPAYVEIDLRDGKIRAGYSPEIGGGVSEAIYEGRVLRYRIDHQLNLSEINTLLEDVLGVAQVEQGPPSVRRDHIERLCSERQTEGGGVNDAEGFFGGLDEDVDPNLTDEDIQAMADDIEWDNDVTITDLYDHLIKRRDVAQRISPVS